MSEVLYADPRWSGSHGIARFSREVLQRLPDQVVGLDLGGSPTHPVDVVRWRRLRLTSHDVVYSPGFNAGLSRARQLLTLHDLIHLDDAAESSRAKSAYYERVVKPVVRKTGAVLTVSRTSAETIRQWLDDDTHVAVVGNGCSPAFVPGGAVVDDTLLYVGNMKPHKNAAVLFHALRLRPDHRLVVVTGDAGAARGAAAAAGVGERVEVRSGVSDEELAALYRAGLGLLMPSTSEGFGLPALEAMMCGRRVACWSGCASVVEIVDGTGVLVDDRTSPEAWAQAIDRLTELASTALVTPDGWTSRFDWDDVAVRVFEQIADAASRG